MFDLSILCSANVEERERLSFEKQQTLLSCYASGATAPVNQEKLLKEWVSLSTMLLDHYATAKTGEVLHELR